MNGGDFIEWRNRKEALILPSGPEQQGVPAAETSGPGFWEKHGRKVRNGALVLGAGGLAYLAITARDAEAPPPRIVIPEVVTTGMPAVVETDVRPVIAARIGPVARPAVTLPPDAENGPFRARIGTVFHTNQSLTRPMAEAMNIAYDRFREHGYTRAAALAFTLQGVHESGAGTKLREVGGGDGAGYFQFSGWNGGGVGAELGQLPKPQAGRNWQPGDFMTTADGGTAASSREAIRNAVDAAVQLIDSHRDYRSLATAARDEGADFAQIARLSTEGFMRPAEPDNLRVQRLTGTYIPNQPGITANLESFERGRYLPTPALGDDGPALRRQP